MTRPLKRIRSADLTNALTAPSSTSLTIDRALHTGLLNILGGSAINAVQGLQRIDAFTLTNGFNSEETKFAWTPQLTKRTIGLSAVRSCVWGLAKTPAEAVALELARFDRRVADGREQTGSLAMYLANAPRGVRGTAMALATTYATELWCGLDWNGFPLHPTIGAQDDVVPLRTAGLLLRGRADVKTQVAFSDGDGTAETRLLILPGSMSQSTALVLGSSALTAVLSGESGLAPARMVGWFPTSGQAVVLPIDRSILTRTALGIVRKTFSEASTSLQAQVA
ncbi:MAG: hypothetical protein WCL38_03715 [Actinomycetota bacterium]